MVPFAQAQSINNYANLTLSNLMPPMPGATETSLQPGEAELTAPEEVTPVPPAQRPTFFYAKPGPWGKLKCFYIYLEPTSAMLESLAVTRKEPRWSFPEDEITRLPALFKEAGLSEMFGVALLEISNRKREDGWVHLFPELPELLAMTPGMRRVIYRELEKHRINQWHYDPIVITTDSVEEWYRTSKLRPELIAKIRQMAYPWHNALAFSDLDALLAEARSDAEARTIMKITTRTRSLMVQLELDAGTDIKAVLDYWTIGDGLRSKDLEPILQSVRDSAEASSLGIVQILPALPRALLYTYPGPHYERQGGLPDCHWTSLNFFNYEPHEYLLDTRLAASFLKENFETVDAPYRYGDVLAFLDKREDSTTVSHSCVYLADDMVFTKNGYNRFRPWVIMNLPDVAENYFLNENIRIQGFRRKRDSGG